ncbi:hypothetical protein A0H81_13392 [Grifola frondosa]|uniref:Uncharacterized protein n=1 Tax=Grifola frondosa TaxID=5627 RepID=A0A1C7LUW7_GRIFR|nr:hypothetical protein A0H81_13392 [Grifola frondosa]
MDTHPAVDIYSSHYVNHSSLSTVNVGGCCCTIRDLMSTFQVTLIESNVHTCSTVDKKLHRHASLSAFHIQKASDMLDRWYHEAFVRTHLKPTLFPGGSTLAEGHDLTIQIPCNTCKSCRIHCFQNCRKILAGFLPGFTVPSLISRATYKQSSNKFSPSKTRWVVESRRLSAAVFHLVSAILVILSNLCSLEG